MGSISTLSGTSLGEVPVSPMLKRLQSAKMLKVRKWLFFRLSKIRGAALAEGVGGCVVGMGTPPHPLPGGGGLVSPRTPYDLWAN
jgi:hypothetical protein